MITKNGSLLIFRLFGIGVYVNWTWLLAPLLRIRGSLDAAGLVSGEKHGVPYHLAWMLALFGIVLLHEFGHALACKSVGGRAESIVLQPLGGVAYVRPPERPGAVLWTIAAGPLVNVVLLPITYVARYIAIAGTNIDVADFAADIAQTNLILLIFNMLPIYPLDGGQIFRSLLWFIFGRPVSLIIAASVGLAGTALLGILMVLIGGGILSILLVAFMGFMCVQALRLGIAQLRLESGPRHLGARCPACSASPPVGAFWRCPCGAKFDTFETGGRCPNCGRTFDTTACPLCGKGSPTAQWQTGAVTPPPYASKFPGMAFPPRNDPAPRIL